MNQVHILSFNRDPEEVCCPIHVASALDDASKPPAGSAGETDGPSFLV